MDVGSRPARYCCIWFWFFVGKLTENCRKTVGKLLRMRTENVGKVRWFRNIPSESSKLVRFTVGKFCWFRNILSSSSELVGLTWLHVGKVFRPPYKWVCYIRSGWRSFPSTFFTVCVHILGWKATFYIQVPINQASSETSSRRPSARCSVLGGYWGICTLFLPKKSLTL